MKPKDPMNTPFLFVNSGGALLRPPRACNSKCTHHTVRMQQQQQQPQQQYNLHHPRQLQQHSVWKSKVRFRGTVPEPSTRLGANKDQGRAGATPSELQTRKQDCACSDPALLSQSTTQLYLYNTMTEQKEPFVSSKPNLATMYTCGPTIYDFAHVGNFRAFLTYDVLKRYLLYRGYEVNHVMNLTDVEDKIIKKIRTTGVTLDKLTCFYADAFFQDGEMLNIIPADRYPKATEHIDEIVQMIERLKDNGFAYEKEGSVYFRVSSFPSYGKLVKLDRRKGDRSNLNKESATNASSNGNGRVKENENENEKDKCGSEPTNVERTLSGLANDASNLDADEYDKDNAADFALWKAYKDEDGEVFWNPSPLSKGRPGWHIECSCMAVKYLGATLDIHAGGIDLVFPHHENEIAQSEAANGCEPFAKYWVHNGFVNIGGEKMSKSLNNFKTIRDVVSNELDARAFRYLIVSSQYRSLLNLTDECIKAAKGAIRRLDAVRSRLRTFVEQGTSGQPLSEDMVSFFNKVQLDFIAHMDDDLNTPRASATMFELVNKAEKVCKSNEMTPDIAARMEHVLNDMNKVLGIFYTTKVYDKHGELKDGSCASSTIEITAELSELLKARAQARSDKNWARADEIRDKLAQAGFTVKDTKEGPQLVALEK